MKTKICLNPGCENPIPPDSNKFRVYCCEPCRRQAGNGRSRPKKNKHLSGLEQQNQQIMENEKQERDDNFALSIISPSTNMPEVSKDGTVQWIIYDLKGKLESAIKEITKWQDRTDAAKDRIIDKEKEISDLKRSIEKMENERDSKSGLGGILDELKDDQGSIDFAGMGTMINGVITGIGSLAKGAAAPSQLVGQDPGVPAEIGEHVSAFTSWFAGLNEEQRTTAWAIINAMASDPSISITFLNILQNGTNTGQQAAI